MKYGKKYILKGAILAVVVVSFIGCDVVDEISDTINSSSSSSSSLDDSSSSLSDSSSSSLSTSSSSSATVLIDPSTINPDSCIQLSSTTISVDTVFEESCYNVSGTITVNENKLLSIKAGTVLFFSSGGIDILGALEAKGTSSLPIVFTSNTKTAGTWDSISFNNAVDDRNELDNVIIEHAGSVYYGALVATGATHLSVKNSIIRNNKLEGFYFGNEVVLNAFTNNISTKNEYTAGRVGVMNLSALDASSDFRGNLGNDYITLSAGTVSQDQRWNALTVPVYVKGALSIKEGKLLTIQEGSSFKFSSRSSITVNGALKAIGTTDKPILFSGATASSGFWDSISFNNAVDDRNELDNVIIEYAGSVYYGALVATGATHLSVKNSIIRNNKLEGFYFGDEVVLNTFSNNISTKNEYTAGRIGVNAVNMLDSKSDFTGNIGNDYVRVAGGTLTNDSNWNALSVPLYIKGMLSIKEGKLLTIQEGTSFKFSSGSSIEVNGALKAIGTTDKPILFSGATASSGFWDSISFNNAVDDRNELDNVIIEYAGSVYYGALVATGATHLSVKNSIIRNNNLYGVWISDKAIVSIENVSYSNNESGDVN